MRRTTLPKLAEALRDQLGDVLTGIAGDAAALGIQAAHDQAGQATSLILGQA